MAEARELTSSFREIVSRFESQIISLEQSRMANQGLAKIEAMSGWSNRSSDCETAALREKTQIFQLQNPVAALGELENDVTLQKEVIACPRCASPEISYRITPSELGFSLCGCG